jgi:mannose-6-phosphate isomerase-like protein (cupin superfamily)
LIIHLSDVPETISAANPLVMRAAITRDAHSQHISVTWVRIHGHHGKMVCNVSDRVYYIINGHGRFDIDGEQPGDVGLGDLVLIPSGVPYVFDGEMDYLVMNGPAFVPGSDERLE